jgi:hypothetical protein
MQAVHITRITPSKSSWVTSAGHAVCAKPTCTCKSRCGNEVGQPVEVKPVEEFVYGAPQPVRGPWRHSLKPIAGTPKRGTPLFELESKLGNSSGIMRGTRSARRASVGASGSQYRYPLSSGEEQFKPLPATRVRRNTEEGGFQVRQHI